MVMVYIPREGAKFGDGDKIKWEVGERAVFHSASGNTYYVTIARPFALHEATPGKRCLDITFEGDESGTTYTVLAERVEPRGGFPPTKGERD